MALSNIFREPRRELTEQGFGLAVMGALIAGVIGGGYFVLWFFNPKNAVDRGFTFVFGMLATFLAFVLLPMLLDVMHEFGESACNSLARMGFDPRPKNRR